MTYKELYVFFGIAVIWLTSCSNQTAERSSVGQAQLEKLYDKLLSRAVEKIEIYYIPHDIETPVALTPANLEQSFSYRVTLERSGVDQIADKLARLADQTKAFKSTQSPEPRLGIAFYGKGEVRLISLYFSGPDCKSGFINETPAQVSDQLCKWAAAQVKVD
jgi:hypothetical protein